STTLGKPIAGQGGLWSNTPAQERAKTALSGPVFALSTRQTVRAIRPQTLLRLYMSLTDATGKTQTLGAALGAAGMAVTVGTALGFQHIGGFMPCKLCLEQRVPFYIGVPVMVLAL